MASFNNTKSASWKAETIQGEGPKQKGTVKAGQMLKANGPTCSPPGYWLSATLSGALGHTPTQ